MNLSLRCDLNKAAVFIFESATEYLKLIFLEKLICAYTADEILTLFNVMILPVPAYVDEECGSVLKPPYCCFCHIIISNVNMPV